MTRRDDDKVGSGGLWLLAGLGAAGLLGGGYAVARSLSPSKAKAVELAAADAAPTQAPAGASLVAPADAPMMPTKPAASQPGKPAASQPGKPAASQPGKPAPSQPGKPAPGALTTTPTTPTKPAAPSSGTLPPLPFQRWTGPIVPPVPADAPRGKLTRSTMGVGKASASVMQSPTVLLEQARTAARDPRITLDELAGARLAASEYGHGSLVELAAIVDAEVNRAAKAGRSLFDSLTRGAGFGRQGSSRAASTRLDPEFVHLWAARAVLVGYARGIARGAVAFFNPETMDRVHAAWKSGHSAIPTSCDAMSLLELWSFDRPRLGYAACPFDSSKIGRDTRAWVGPIEGVDPWRLMLLAPANTGPAHLGAYVAARKIIDEGRRARAQKANV